MKVCVVIPPIRDFYFTGHRFAALGASVVVKVLKKWGAEVSFFNFPLEKNRQLPLPSELGYLKPFLLAGEGSRLSYFTAYKHYGPTCEECAELLLAEKPDLLLFSLFAFCYGDQLLELCRHLKTLAPALRIAAGGAGITAYPGYFRRAGVVDNLLIGEAEAVLPPFLDSLEQGTLGQEPQAVPVLSRARELEMELPVVHTLTTRSFHYFSLMLTRGCRKGCRFCVNHDSRDFRKVSLESLRRELDRLASVSEIREKELRVNFEDDNLLHAKTYLFEAIEEFRSRFERVSFYMENGIDYTLLDEESLEKLITAGMKQFNISLGTMDPSIMKQQGRIVRPERYQRILHRLKEADIPAITYFICGFAGDTPEGIVSTLRYLASQETLIGISLFYPVPGLPDFQDYALFDSRPSALCTGSAAYPWNGSLTTSQLVTAFRLSRFINLTRASAVSEQESRLITHINEEKRLFTLVKGHIVPVPGLDEGMQESFFR